MVALLLALGLAVAIGGPILAIVAFSRVRRIEGALGELAVLRRRIDALDEQLREPAGRPRAPVAETPPPWEIPAATMPAAPRAPAPAPRTAARVDPGLAQSDLESLIAGRWLNRVGLVLVFVAAFFALQWEFDNDVLGATGRVALWTLLGAGLIAYGQWLLGRGHRYLSEGLTGLGGAVLYLTLYVGWNSYALLPQAAAFAAMAAVTAALVAIAVGRDSERIALLALVGGFATPLLTGSGRDAQVVLFGYLLVLDGGLLAVARSRDWRTLGPLAFVGSTAYFWAWYQSFYAPAEPLLRTAAFATLFFAVFTAMPVLRARASGRLFPEQAILLLANAGNYLFALYLMLWPERRWSLTAAVLALAALHLLLARGVPSVAPERPLARMSLAGLALTFATLAIPIRLEGAWITIAWAVQGAVLVWSGFAARWDFLRGAGLVLLAIAVYRLALVTPTADAFLLNARLGAFAVLIACFGVALYLWRRQPEQVGAQERPFFAALGVGINVLAVCALSLEVDQYFRPELAGDPDAVRAAALGRELSLSLLWTLYASGLVVAGVRGGVAAVRWQGLALFGLVVGKVFLLDLSFLDGGHRILSSIVLGVVLIGVSFLYQRALVVRQSGAAP